MNKGVIAVFLFIIFFISPIQSFGSDVTDVRDRIDNVQAGTLTGTPSAPVNMDQKGYIGVIIARLFETTGMIKTSFLIPFQSIFNTQINTIPRWNGQSFTAGTIRDNGTSIGIGTGVLNNRRVNIFGDINFSGDLYKNGTLYSPNIPSDVVRTFGDQIISGIKTFNNNSRIQNTTPISYYLDTNGRSAMIHVNNNNFYVLRGAGTGSTDTSPFNGVWPLRINLENNNAVFGGNIGIGVDDPLEKLEVNGKIVMHLPTELDDEPDTVATKGYVDSKLVQTKDTLVGFTEVALNLGEDTYEPLVTWGSSWDMNYAPGIDTCDTNVGAAYTCQPEDNKGCRDWYSYQIEIRSGDDNRRQETRYRSRPVVCVKAIALIRTEGGDYGIKTSNTGTARIIARDYSGIRESCTVSINIPASGGNPSCVETRGFGLGWEGSDGECEQYLESYFKSEAICTNFKGVKTVDWNRSGDAGRVNIQYYGF